MDTKQVNAVLELEKTANFMQAAKHLFISQPTLTYQIQAIENEVGFKIFERTRGGAQLTSAGQTFISSLRETKMAMQKAIEHGQNLAATDQQSVRIGLPTRAALYYLPEVISQMRHVYPGVTVTPSFSWHHGVDQFQQGQLELLFSHDITLKKQREQTRTRCLIVIFT
ncbi:LysR family transcriptional regulator [Lactiplantibacillus carotarum]|uniref:LysR family transcriptional regulator n=1 Tax=Lactiplantibacillus carotarum TaxID=2993456 RepID=UPI00298F0346|nr:LysR family transcriptional regulator [Lactiplantibacillus carotarum]